MGAAGAGGDLDDGFADMPHASFLYADPERGQLHGAPPDQIPFVGNPRFKPEMGTALAEAKRIVTETIPPLQIAGGVGDVILTHGRLWHMGSANCVPGTMRSAMFCASLLASAVLLFARAFSVFVRFRACTVN